MADVYVEQQDDWREFQQNKNCFAPALIGVATEFDIKNVEFERAANVLKLGPMSEHFIGRLMRRESATHGKIKSVLKAYSFLKENRPELPQMTDRDIVAAIFTIPNLRDIMTAKGSNCIQVATKAGIELATLEMAISGGRVTGGIACAIRRALYSADEITSEAPPMPIFAHCKPGGASRAIKGSPFRLSELNLPLDLPNPWPHPAASIAGLSVAAAVAPAD